eukprot:TRINITY_DN5753_c0_g1_i1.p1 TRINITY_DN5753_c0_g1~~TRINITY_DN5753_c0_g1_i1.p1  ORF type:complete len:352 (-),score=88.58 TRINITY_DN5753_c0_g1_i1:37-1092(-)
MDTPKALDHFEALIRSARDCQAQFQQLEEQNESLFKELENIKLELERTKIEKYRIQELQIAGEERIQAQHKEIENMKSALKDANTSKDKVQQEQNETAKKLVDAADYISRLAADAERLRIERDGWRDQYGKEYEASTSLRAALDDLNRKAAMKPSSSLLASAPSISSSALIGNQTPEAVALISLVDDALKSAFTDITRSRIVDLRDNQNFSASPFRDEPAARRLRELASRLLNEIDLSCHLFIEAATLNCGGLSNLMGTLLSFGKSERQMFELSSVDLVLPFDFPKFRILATNILEVHSQFPVFTSPDANAAAKSLTPKMFSDIVEARNAITHRGAALQIPGAQNLAACCK